MMISEEEPEQCQAFRTDVEMTDSSFLSRKPYRFNCHRGVTGFLVTYERNHCSKTVTLSHMRKGRIVRIGSVNGSELPSVVSKYQKWDDVDSEANEMKVLRYYEAMTYVWYNDGGKIHRDPQLDEPAKIIISTTRAFDKATEKMIYNDVTIIELFYRNGRLHRNVYPAWLEYRTTVRGSLKLCMYRNFIDGLRYPVSDKIPCYLRTINSSVLEYQMITSRTSNKVADKSLDVYADFRIEKEKFEFLNGFFANVYNIYRVIGNNKSLMKTMTETDLEDMVGSWYPIDTKIHPVTEKLCNGEYPFYRYTNEDELIGESTKFVIFNVWSPSISAVNFAKPEIPFQREMQMIVDE